MIKYFKSMLVVMMLSCVCGLNAAPKVDDDAELKALGDQVRRGDAKEKILQAELKQKIATIKADSSLPEYKKTYALEDAFKAYQKESRKITVEYRKAAQDKLFSIANSTTDSGPLVRETAGTKIGDENHRGWTGDTDAGGSATKAKKLADAAKKMGLAVQESPGYLHVDGLDLTVHKEGALGRPGTEAHFVQIAVDAKSHETYVSASMDSKQPGKKYVETNDHIKKALDGATASVSELSNNQEKLQGLVKGTLKSYESSGLTRFRVKEIMKKHGYEGQSTDFLGDISALKRGKSVAVETAGMDAKKLAKLQAVCKDVLIEAKAAAAARFETEVFQQKQQIAKLKAEGNKVGAAKLEAQLFDSVLRARETGKIADSGLKKAGAERYKPPTGDTDIDPLGGLGGDDTPSTKAGSGTTTKISKAVGYAGAALSAYDAWKQECEQAAAEGREVSYGRVGVNAALNLSGVSGYVNQAVAAKDQLTTRNTAYVDSQLDDLQRAGYDLAKISDAQLLMITTKSTIRTAVMTSYEAAKVVPVAGEIIGGVENTLALGTSGYGAVMAEIEKNRILAENAAAQEKTLDSALRRSRTAIPLLESIAAQYQDNAAAMQSLEKMLGSYDNFVAVKQQLDNNRRNCSSMTEYAGEVKSGVGLSVDPSDKFDSVKKESNRISAGVDALLKGQKEQKISKEEFQNQGRKLLDACMTTEETMADALKILADIQALAEAGPMIDGIKSYQDALTRDLADAKALSQNAKAAAGQYRKLLNEQQKLHDAFENIKKRTIDGIDFFSAKRTKAGSDQELQLDKARDMITGISIGRLPETAAAARNSERLDKMAGLLDNINTAAPAANAAGINAKEVDAAQRMANRLNGPAEQAAAALQRAIKQVGLLNLDLPGGTMRVRVVDSGSSEVITGASAELVPVNGGEKLRSETNGDSQEITGIEPGVYNLNVSADGYESVVKRFSLKTEAEEKDTDEVVKLKPLAGKQALREEKQDTVEVENKARLVDDAALKKAENVLRNITSYARDGKFQTKEILLQRNQDYYGLTGSVAEYAGMRQHSNVVALFLLGYTPEGNELLARTRNLAFAAMAEYLGDYMYSRYFPDHFGTISEAIAAAPKDDYSALAATMQQSYLDQLADSGLNCSSLLYYDAYKVFHAKKFATGKLRDDLGREKEDEWPKIAAVVGPMMKKGGYAGLRTELDTFWKSAEWKKICPAELTVDANHVIARDYRRKFIRESLLKPLKLWLKDQRLDASKQLVAALDLFCNGFKNAQLSVRGRLISKPDSFQYEITTEIGDKKEVQTIGEGQFMRVFRLAEMKSGSIRVNIYPLRHDGNLFWISSGGNNYNYYLNSRDLPLQTSIRGWNIDVEIPTVNYVCKKTNYAAYKQLPAGLINNIPSPIPDRLQEFNGSLNQSLSSFRNQAIPQRQAEVLIRDQLYGLEIWQREAAERYSYICSILDHNYNINSQKAATQSAASADSQRSSALRKEAATLSENVSKLSRMVNDALSAEIKKRGDRKTALYQEINALTQQRNKLAGELSDATRKSISLLGQWGSLSGNVDDARDPRTLKFNVIAPDSLPTYYDESLTKFLNEIKPYSATFELLPGLKARTAALNEQQLRIAEELVKCDRLWKGPMFFEKDYANPKTCYENHFYELDSSQDYLREIDMLQRIKAADAIRQGITETEKYLARRQQKAGSFSGLIAEIDGVMTRLPSEAEVSAADAAFAPLSENVMAYAQAMSTAVMQKNTGKVTLPAGLKNEKGSDAEFVNRTVNAMRDIISRYPEAVADVIPGRNPEKSALLQAQNIISQNISHDLPEDVRKKINELSTKMSKVYSARKTIYMMAVFGLFEAVEKQGTTPESRVAALLEMNKKMLKSLDSQVEMVKTASPSECVDWLKKSQKWFGQMPDVPTLDCLRRRGELQQIIAKRGVLDALRQERGLPAAPGQMFINDSPVSPDCTFLILRYGQLPNLSAELAKAYATTEYKDKFKKSFFYRLVPPPVESGLKLELAHGNNVFYFYYDQNGKPQEMPVGKEYLPCTYNFTARIVGRDGKTSWLGVEPGVTIVVLP